MNDSPDKHAARSVQNLVAGLVIVAIGVYLLLHNFGVAFPFPFLFMHNWWALFILIAAVGPLTQAIHAYRLRGRVDIHVARPALSALIIVTIALMFLFDVSWNRWWPVFVIYGGLWIVFRERVSGD